MTLHRVDEMQCQKRRCCRPLPQAPTQRGSWIANHLQTRCYCGTHLIDVNCEFRIARLPLEWALKAIETPSRASTTAAIPLDLGERDKVSNDTLAGELPHLSNLPTEILLQIFRLLVPTGDMFHFTPTVQGPKQVRRVISVHRIVHTSADKSAIFAINVSSMSTVCHRLRDVIYSILYGENQFLFELSTSPLVSHVLGFDPKLHESWTKAIRSRPTALAPLSESTAKFLTSLTICIYVRFNDVGKTAEWSKLREWMRAIAGSLCQEDGGYELKHLVLNVDIANPDVDHSNRTVSSRLEIDDKNGLHLRPRRTYDELSKDVEPSIAENYGDLLEPLECLKGILSVELIGAIGEHHASRFRQAVSSARVEESDIDRCAKRRRLNGS